MSAEFSGDNTKVQRQLTKDVGLSQSVRLQSTDDNSDKNIILKLPPNATGISVEHSSEKSLDGTNLRVILNISVLQSNESTPESEQSNQLFKTVETKFQRHRELKVNIKQQNEILINGLSKNVSEDDLLAYFSQFGDVETCGSFVEWGYVTFKSPDAVKQVLNFAPHYIIADKITNESAELLAVMKKFMRTKYQNYRELKFSRNPFSEYIISIDGLTQDISQDAIRDYFSQFGHVNFCENKWPKGWVSFKSSNAVNEVLNSGSHHIVGDRIINENQELFALMKKAMPIKHQSQQELKNENAESLVKRELKVTISRLAKEWFSKIYTRERLAYLKMLAIGVVLIQDVTQASTLISSHTHDSSEMTFSELKKKENPRLSPRMHACSLFRKPYLPVLAIFVGKTGTNRQLSPRGSD
ncbi:RNA recognition motif domain-containing protein [Ditylenchus destructor]|uniref:RNA recognition motif domain-containing protein n=1 Tax=Ditylenchus destructor TaxID=166010 RepID=A0AAD4MS09_9BILA|nr:RNA recognition motif domain-containing protein [Ditylenchus destructor]